MRTFVVAAGLACAALFPVLEIAFSLHLYGDGSIFSYGVAVRDVWNIHWRNIPVRVFAYLYAMAPAEWVVGVTGNTQAGILTYALLRSSAQLAGLALTYATDRSPQRIVFTFACASTALLCPLVAGFPTEMWIAHAAYWPMLALALFAPASVGGFAALLVAVLALFLSHEGGIVMTGATLLLLGLDRSRRMQFARLVVAVLIAFAVWLAVKLLVPPEEYVAKVMERAALNVLNFDLVLRAALVVPLVAAAAYSLIYAGLRRAPSIAIRVGLSALLTAAGLAVYWLVFDHSLHTEGRYFLRTVIILAAPAFGMIAGLLVMRDTGPGLFSRARQELALLPAGALAGAFAMALLVHAVETAKFVTAWQSYLVRLDQVLASADADIDLGDIRFISARRLPADMHALAWGSTTPYLSVLRGYRNGAHKLVVDPDTRFFWLSCDLARRHVSTAGAMPAIDREMVRSYACLADRTWPSMGLKTQASRTW